MEFNKFLVWENVVFIWLPDAAGPAWIALRQASPAKEPTVSIF